MKYDFGSKDWKNDFEYAYSLVTSSFATFTEESDHLVNRQLENSKYYEYISIVHKDVYGKGARVSAKCSFDSYGAPLLTFANSLWTDGEGNLRYGDHYEVVAYEKGCNVWFITKAPEGSASRFVSKNCLRLRFPIEDKSMISMSVEIMDKVLRVQVNEASFDLPVPELGDEVYIGITACEGINRFYEAEITKK